MQVLTSVRLEGLVPIIQKILTGLANLYMSTFIFVSALNFYCVQLVAYYNNNVEMRESDSENLFFQK